MIAKNKGLFLKRRNIQIGILSGCGILFLFLVKYAESGICTKCIVVFMTVVLWAFSTWLEGCRLGNYIAWIGKHSMEYYLCQMICLDLGLKFVNIEMRIIINFIGCFMVTTVLTCATNRNAYMKRILYGR